MKKKLRGSVETIIAIVLLIIIFTAVDVGLVMSGSDVVLAFIYNRLLPFTIFNRMVAYLAYSFAFTCMVVIVIHLHLDIGFTYLSLILLLVAFVALEDYILKHPNYLS